MNTELLALEDHLEVLSEEEFETPAEEEEAAEFGAISVQVADIVRIEEQVSFSYGGVTSCCHQDRVNAEARAARDRWVKDKLFQYRHWRMVRYGNLAGRVRCTQYKDPWTGKRSCSGRGGMPCYIEFRKP